MKFSYEGNSVSDCFYMALRDHRNYATKQHIRSTTRYELLDYTITLNDPLQNLLFIPYRYTNPPAIIAETLWVFAGRIDMFFLKYYLKNAMKYSDDGKVWRGGYGKRLIAYDTADDKGLHLRINQVNRMINYIKKDRNTSRALLVIPDGSDYHMNEDDDERKDEPCTIFVQYLMRGNELHCFTRMRSNDLILGCFNVNLFEWTFLQQLVCNEIHATPGPYAVNAVSMHIYDDWMKRVKLLLYAQQRPDIYSIITPHRLTLDWSTFMKQISPLLAIELKMREFGPTPEIIDMIDQGNFHPDLKDMFYCMGIASAIKKQDIALITDSLDRINNEVYVLACLEYLVRKLGQNYYTYIRTMFFRTFGDKHTEFHKELDEYIFHSRDEQETIDNMNGVRR